MFEKQIKSAVKDSLIIRLKRFNVLMPYALIWYLARSIRQLFWLIFFKTIGRYAFRSIGSNVRIDGMPDILWPCADIRLGNYVRIGKRCVFQGFPDSSIFIEDNVTINDGCFLTAIFGIIIGKGTSIGEYTSIRDYNHGFHDGNIPIKEQDYVGAQIVIGRDCWIGRGCVILPGVIIGDGAVVGANSVVNKDIPPFGIVAGVPAKIIKYRNQ
jgi:acetyltransferase-like isoleucine patch superfamily enzyme